MPKVNVLTPQRNRRMGRMVAAIARAEAKAEVRAEERGSENDQSHVQRSTMVFHGKTCARRRIGAWNTPWVRARKPKARKGHDNLNHVENDIVKKEVDKRRAAAKAKGVKPDGTGPGPP